MDALQSPSLKPRKILVVAMPYLGDVLLATPLFHALKQAYPSAHVDVLVFRNTVAMLEGNPDITQIITIPNRPKWRETWQLIKQIFRRYDLAMAIQTGDRPFFYTLLAAPMRVTAVPPKGTKTWWKRFFVQKWTEFDNHDTHTVLQNLKLLDLINVPRCYDLIPPRVNNEQQCSAQFSFLTDKARYAVLHLLPQWTYKRWNEEAWVETGHYLKSLGLTLVLSGSAAPEEMAVIRRIVARLPDDTVNLAGQVSIAQLAHVIAQAVLFIGPDTGITHLAAATGIPVIALFGPTNPVKWAPWPSHYYQDNNPFDKIGTQQVNNVFLIQGEGDCVPCHQEGCDRHRLSHSDCLDNLSAKKIQAVAWSILNTTR